MPAPLESRLLSAIPRLAALDLSDRLPKAELHVHIEGTLEPEQAFALAARNGVALPYASPDQMRRAFAFADLQGFLDIYYAAAAVLVEEDDFRDLMRAYLRRAHADGVVRAEIFFDPQTHTSRGVPVGTVIRGLSRGIEEARRETGLSAALILCFLRHLSATEAIETLEAALPFREAFIGVGLDSAERGNPPERFREVFARARAFGLHAVAHAGEEGPAASVAGALEALGAERIDHGLRCLEDRSLVRRLAAGGVPLTVCPFSNVRLRVVDRLVQHPLPAMLRAGLRASLHSDDPAYFGGYVADTYRGTTVALDLSASDLYVLARNGLASAFESREWKDRQIDRLDELFTLAAEGRPPSPREP